MYLKFTSIIIILMFSINGYTQAGRYVWKYNTIAHRLLEIEEVTMSNNNESDSIFDVQYKIIDSFLDQCLDKIRIQNPAKIKDRATVLQILEEIDVLLAKNNFFICVKIERFSAALTSTPKNSLKCSYCNFFKSYRQQYFDKAKNVYHIDCDLGSFLYLAVGEVLGLPLKFVEVPNHNFVRWYVEGGLSINWDVNTAQSYDDDVFRNGATPTVKGSKYSFDKILEIRYSYLQNYSINQVLSYYYFVIARDIKSQKQYDLSKKYYMNAIAGLPTNPKPKHYLAYTLIFTGAFVSKEDFLLANLLVKEALISDPGNKDIVETLACSYAVLGNFDEAINTIKNCKDADVKFIWEFQCKRDGITLFREKYDVFDDPKHPNHKN